MRKIEILYFGCPQGSEQAIRAADLAWRDYLQAGLKSNFSIEAIVKGLDSSELSSLEEYRRVNGDRLLFALLLSEAEGSGGP